jgi:hypothetical protein
LGSSIALNIHVFSCGFTDHPVVVAYIGAVDAFKQAFLVFFYGIFNGFRLAKHHLDAGCGKGTYCIRSDVPGDDRLRPFGDYKFAD